MAVSASGSGPWAGRWTPMLGLWEGGGVKACACDPLRTGDLGTVDDDGWIRVVDRRKLLILRGGANVYPAEVERVLLGFPGVAGAAVFGIPDERLGERVAALVEVHQDEPHPTAPALESYCAEHLARYKIPQVWGFVDTLPRNSMGKVIRTGLPGLLAGTLSV